MHKKHKNTWYQTIFLPVSTQKHVHHQQKACSWPKKIRQHHQKTFFSQLFSSKNLNKAPKKIFFSPQGLQKNFFGGLVKVFFEMFYPKWCMPYPPTPNDHHKNSLQSLFITVFYKKFFINSRFGVAESWVYKNLNLDPLRWI